MQLQIMVNMVSSGNDDSGSWHSTVQSVSYTHLTLPTIYSV